MLDSPTHKQSAFAGAPSRPAATEPSILPLRATNLTYSVTGKLLVDIAELEIRDGGPTLLLGPNGAGKSILLRLLHGLIEPMAGSISYHGQRIDNFIRRRQAMVFQRPVVLRRSVAANIDYALKAGGIRGAERRQRLAELLELGNFSRQARQAARTLSGGEQQRLALIRAIACRPQLLFLDEPTSSLDPAATLLIETLIGQAAQAGTKIVMVTHDIGQARRLAEEIVFVHRGVVLEKTLAAQFFDGPQSGPARDFLAGQLIL